VTLDVAIHTPLFRRKRPEPDDRCYSILVAIHTPK